MSDTVLLLILAGGAILFWPNLQGLFSSVTAPTATTPTPAATSAVTQPAVQTVPPASQAPVPVPTTATTQVNPLVAPAQVTPVIAVPPVAVPPVSLVVSPVSFPGKQSLSGWDV